MSRCVTYGQLFVSVMNDLLEVLLRCDRSTLAHLAGPSRQYPRSFTAGIYDRRNGVRCHFAAALILLHRTNPCGCDFRERHLALSRTYSRALSRSMQQAGDAGSEKRCHQPAEESVEDEENLGARALNISP